MSNVKRLLGSAAGGLDLDYYWLDIYGYPAGWYIMDIQIDSQGNSVEGFYNGDTQGTFIVKRSPDGQVLWERKLTQSYYGTWALESPKIGFTSTDDILLAFKVDQNGGSIGLIKLNGSNGTTSAGPTIINGQSGSIDLSGTPSHVTELSNGKYAVMAGSSGIVHVFNSNLTVSTYGYNMANRTNLVGFDSNGYAVCWRGSFGGTISGQYYFTLIRFDLTNGTKISERRLQHTGTELNPTNGGYTTDGTNSYYIANSSNGSNLIKTSGQGTSETIQWIKYNASVNWQRVKIASNGDVIVTGFNDSYTMSTNRSVNIVSLNPSTGALNYIHTFGGTGSNASNVDNYYNLALDQNDNIYVAANNSGVSNKVAVLKVPLAGAADQYWYTANTGISYDLRYYTGITASLFNQYPGAATNTSTSSFTVGSSSGSIGSYGSISNVSSSLTHTLLSTSV